jgi:tetratricopeptide (TPR) repeat protein
MRTGPSRPIPAITWVIPPGTCPGESDPASDAVEAYKLAVKLVPADVNYRFNLATAHFNNGEFRQAEGILEEILPLINDPEMKEKAGSYLKTIKEKEKDGTRA